MIALQLNRSGLRFKGRKRNRSEALDRLLHDDRLSIQRYADFTPHQTNIDGLPLACGLAGVFERLNPAVESAIDVGFDGFSVVVLNLNFVAAAQADAAVRPFRDVVLRMQNKVPVASSGDQIEIGRASCRER